MNDNNKEDYLKWMFVSDSGIVTELAPITSLSDFHAAEWQLGEVFVHGNPATGRDDQLFFRGTSCMADLGCRVKVSTASLKATFDICRRKTDIRCSDAEFYWLMRHAGIDNTSLLDWSRRPEVAMWFAIHDGCKEKLRKSGEGVLWVWHPDEEDWQIPDGEQAPIPDSGVSKTVVYYPYDCEERHERPTKQEAIAVRLRFRDPNDKCKQSLLPMNEDGQFKGRLLKIAIKGDYEAINEELNQWRQNEMHDSVPNFCEYLGFSQEKGEYIIPEALIIEMNSKGRN